MAWIESHQELGAHPKTRRLARALGCSIPAAIGHLHCLWWWALDYAPDGNLAGLDLDDIAVACMWEGDPEVLVAALSAARFVDEDGLLHDWQDYAGKLMESRARNAGRGRNMRRAYTDGTIRAVRERDRNTCRYCGGAVDWADRKSGHGGTYDHVIPGGPTIPENLVVACRGCNSRKGSRTPEQARMALNVALDATSDAHLTTVPYPTVPYPTVPPTPPPPAREGAPAQGAATAIQREARAPRPANAGPRPMTTEQRETLLATFGAIPDVEAVLEIALAHKARLKSTNEYLYARNWLRSELQRFEEHEARMARANGRPPPMKPAIPDEYDVDAYLARQQPRMDAEYAEGLARLAREQSPEGVSHAAG